jgi:uncharacterized cupin superfamily protein
MPDTLLRLDPAAALPETSRPAPDRLVAGDPEFTTWTLEARDGLYAGLWRSTPGKWRVVYDEWEYCRLIEGRSVVTGEDGSRVVLGPGDALILRPGFRGTWEVVETTLKDFVVRV